MKRARLLHDVDGWLGLLDARPGVDRQQAQRTARVIVVLAELGIQVACSRAGGRLAFRLPIGRRGGRPRGRRATALLSRCGLPCFLLTSSARGLLSRGEPFPADLLRVDLRVTRGRRASAGESCRILFLLRPGQRPPDARLLPSARSRHARRRVAHARSASRCSSAAGRSSAPLAVRPRDARPPGARPALDARILETLGLQARDLRSVCDLEAFDLAALGLRSLRGLRVQPLRARTPRARAARPRGAL